MRTSLLLLTAALLVPATASAQDRYCWTLTSTQTVPYQADAFDVTGSRWALKSETGSITITGAQTATIERPDDKGSRVAWSTPPSTWCSDGPVDLAATASGNLGGVLYDSYPVANLVRAVEPTPPVPMSGVAQGDALYIPGPDSTDLHGSVRVSPRAPGGQQWTLTARIDMGNGQWVGVVWTYDRMDSADGVASTAPTAPPAVLSMDMEPDGGQPSAGDPPGDGATEQDDDEGTDDDEEKDGGKEPSYLSDVNRGWFHIGGGFGFVDQVDLLSMGGRFTAGLGFYTFMFYAGGGFEADFRLEVPAKLHGVGYVGMAIPVPVFHPLLGFKIAGGAALYDRDLVPVAGSLALGGQAGFILRKFGGGPGFRFMVEPTYAIREDVGFGEFELWFTFAGVI